MNYNTINWNERTPDEALDIIYNELIETNEKFSFLKFLIKNYPGLDIEWLETFEDIKDELILEEDINDYLFFVNWYKKHNPEDYNERYEFVERSLIDYYFFKKCR